MKEGWKFSSSKKLGFKGVKKLGIKEELWEGISEHIGYKTLKFVLIRSSFKINNFFCIITLNRLLV